jgi:AcrR family transcriptional regulator
VIEARARERRTSRERSLVDAAIEVFRDRGVVRTTVDDIVVAAGVAKGTFYLYFRTKDDVVNAVAERIVSGTVERIERALLVPGGAPQDPLRAFGIALRDVGAEPYERELVELFHRPGNQAVHDRMSERMLARLAPLLANVIADGIAAGSVRPQDPTRAAAFVLACYGALHHVVSSPDDLPTATVELEAFVMRGLGIEEA